MKTKNVLLVLLSITALGISGCTDDKLRCT